MIEAADRDGNDVVDYAEFEKLWNQIRGDSEVYIYFQNFLRNDFCTFMQNERKIRKEFSKLDTDKSGFITRGRLKSNYIRQLKFNYVL